MTTTEVQGVASDVDVLSWLAEAPAKLDLDSFLDLRREVLSRPRARAQLEKKLAEFKAEPGKGDDALRTGLGYWLAGSYRRSAPFLEASHEATVARYAFAEVLLFGGQLGLEGLKSRPSEAADLLLKIKKPHHHEAVILLRALITTGRHDEAAKVLSSQGASFAATADGKFFTGVFCEHAGDYAGAEAAFGAALELDGDHVLTLFHMARWYDLSGEDSKALGYYERLANASPPQINALVNLGVLYEDQERYREAAYCYRRILAVYPQHPRARLFLKDAEASYNMYYDEEQEVRQDRKNQILKIPVSDFELSVRSRNCLAKMNIVTLGDLVEKTEAELLSYKNFGETSLNEIKQILESKGLRLGMRPEDDLSPVAPGTHAPAPGTPAPQTFTVDPNDDRLKKLCSEMNLSVRARKCLANLNIRTIGDLVNYTADDLLGQRNFGVTSLKEIIDQIEQMGLSLRTVER